MARQPTFKIESWETKAMVVLMRQVREAPEFSAGLAAAERAAHAAMVEYRRIKSTGGTPIAYMRSRGGWPTIIREAFEAEVGDATVPGSQLIAPIRIASQLDAFEIERIRNAVIDA